MSYIPLTNYEKKILNDIRKNQKTFKFIQQNPKIQGAYDRYEKYKCATNYNQFIEFGGKKDDLRNDLQKKYIILDGIDNIDGILPDNNSEHSISSEISDVGEITEEVNIVNEVTNKLIKKTCPPELNVHEIINNNLLEQKENIKIDVTDKRLKTPLRYAGGKSKAIYILEYLQDATLYI